MTHINSRRDTATVWNAQDPILMLGEIGIETDSSGVALAAKCGDGVTSWSGLDYFIQVPDLSAYAPKDSPNFTGHPTTPTPSPGSDDTSVATTEFVTEALTAYDVTVSGNPPASPVVGEHWYHASINAEMIWRGSYWQPLDSGALVQVLAKSTVNIASLSGFQTIDGLITAEGYNVLLTNQTTASENGPWTVHSGAWTRTEGFKGYWFAGQRFRVLGGTAWANSEWTCSLSGPVGSANPTLQLTGGDSGWIQPALSSPFVVSASNTPAVRRVGKTVHWSGRVSRTGGFAANTNYVVIAPGALPSWAFPAPADDDWHPLTGDTPRGAVADAVVQSTGLSINMLSGATGIVSLSGMSGYLASVA